MLAALVTVPWLLTRPAPQAGGAAPVGAAPAATGVVAPGPDVPVSRPVSLDIPAIELARSPLGELGLNPDGTVEVPVDFATAGWFDLGPTPGQVGASVLLGHVDSTTGPAVFFRLRSLEAGDLVEVGLADGTVARFAVGSVETYPKAEFPARRVYTSVGSRDLRLVTCGGEFDPVSRSYESNVVVYATLVDTVPA
ncbi:class F sortase [Pseudonocardia petroleophila]|uniref:Class F sortase n=1 Tax=Pseudonocardia petroleophila TaxID=37331 RepID=A0A7G7MRD5_9PSEU|nr:class F sortase [Pseudonocardia petroleophila]